MVDRSGVTVTQNPKSKPDLMENMKIAAVADTDNSFRHLASHSFADNRGILTHQEVPNLLLTYLNIIFVLLSTEGWELPYGSPCTLCLKLSLVFVHHQIAHQVSTKNHTMILPFRNNLAPPMAWVI